MRGFVFVVALAGLVLAAITWVAAPTVAAGRVRDAMRTSGIATGDVAVDVAADPPLSLLIGHADAVRVRADDAELDRLHARSLDLTFIDVDLFARSFASLDGTLQDVRVGIGDGATVMATTVGLHGPGRAVVATIHVSRSAAEAAFGDVIASAIGRSIDGVTLSAPDLVRFRAGPLFASAHLLVVDDGLVLDADLAGRPRTSILRPRDPLAVASVSVDTDLVISGTIDGSTWLSSPPGP